MAQVLPVVPCNDPTRFCRLCFSQHEMNWVIRTNGTEVDAPFIAMIGECLGLWLQLDEDFPCAVCRSCTSMLELILQFREDSRLCDAALREKRQQDPSALQLFYDYPEDKVFVNGSARPGFIEDDSDFENEPHQPEVIISEKSENTAKLFRLDASQKARALIKYFESYAKWTAETAKIKDDDEETVIAPESFEQMEDPELRVLCEKYVLDQGDDRQCQQVKNLSKHGPRQQTVVSPDELKCTECGKQFGTLTALNGHSLRHQTHTLISCQICGIQFVKQNELTAHIKNRACRFESHMKCKYCERRFSNRGRYMFHLKTLHSDKPIPRSLKVPPKRVSKASRNNVLMVKEHKRPEGVVPIPRLNSSSTTPSASSSTKTPRLPRDTSGPSIPTKSILPSLEEGQFVVLLEPINPELLRASFKDPAKAATANKEQSVPRRVEQVVCTVCYNRFESIEKHNQHLSQCRDSKGIWSRTPKDAEPPAESEPMEILGD